MQDLDRRKVLYVVGAIAVLGLAYNPWKLLALFYLPAFLIFGVTSVLLLHLVLAYFAAFKSVQYSRTDHWDTSRARNPIVPLLSIATPAGIQAIKVKKAWSKQNTSFRQPLHPTSLAVSAALDRIIAVILDNHLLSWYTVSISPGDPSFPNAVEKTIREALADIRDRLVKVDWANIGVSTLLPKITSHLELFQEAQQSLTESSISVSGHQGYAAQKDRKKKQSPGATVASEEMDLLLSNKYAELAGDKGLHDAVSGASFNSRPSEEKHLRTIIGNILALVLPENERKSSAVSTMAMEIVACAVIRPIIEAISDPDLWNRMIDDKAGAFIREQRMVNKLRAALDASPAVPVTPGKKRSEAISVKSNTKQFESFIRSLARCSNLLEAKRLRNDVEVSLRRARLPGAFPEETSDSVVKYVDRLVTAKQTIDRRISELGGGDSLAKATSPVVNSITLHDILHQPGALSFLMEYMDRKSRSMLVQFYLTVEGIKDPLEEADDGQGAYQISTQMYADPTTAQALRDDIQLLLSTYLNAGAVVVSNHILTTLQAFDAASAKDSKAPLPLSTYRALRRTVFAAQDQVYEDMVETDWPAFQRSDLFMKAMSEIPTRTLYSSATPMRPGDTSPLRTRRSFSSPDVYASPRSSPSPGASAAATKTVTRPAPGQKTRTASTVSITRNALVRTASRQSTDGGAREDPFKSDNLDFLTGAVSGRSEESKERTPLFQDELSNSIQSLIDPIAEEPDNLEQLQTMEAIQEALESILASDETSKDAEERPASPHSRSSPEPTSTQRSPNLSHRGSTDKVIPPSSRPPRSLFPSRPPVYARTASLQSQHSKNSEDYSDADIDDQMYDSDDIAKAAQLAAPGNLELPVEIERITLRIDKLNKQREVLSALLRKADLTGNTDETKILMKSISALKREMSELTFQKKQFEAQANENKLLPGRTAVTIVGTTVGQAQGKEFALYLIEVHQLAEDGATQVAGWLVTRRYSEFVALHSSLKDKLPAVRNLELPHKRLVTSLSSALLQQRRTALEKYLQAVIRIPNACSNRDLQAFLSQQNISLTQTSSSMTSAYAIPDIFPGQNLVRNLFRTVTSGMEDVFGGPSMLDAIILRLSQQAADFAGSSNTSAQNEDLISSVLDGTATSGNDAPMDLLALSASLQPVEGEGLTYFTAPIANLLVEVFDLKDKGSWLRRQAIVIILQQVLGGTIERKVREAISVMLADDSMVPYIDMMSNIVWPDGKLKEPTPPRTADEKLSTRESAYRKLAYLMPDVAASIIGRSNARRGARRIFAVMQNRRLNQHLIYTLLDDILFAVFGEDLHHRRPPG